MSNPSSSFCILNRLPQELLRLVLECLTWSDIKKLEELLLKNKELLSHFLSSIKGLVLKEKLGFRTYSSDIYKYKVFVEELEVRDNFLEQDFEFLNYIRPKVKILHFKYYYYSGYSNYSVSYNYSHFPASSVGKIGYFPSLKSVTFESCYFDNEIILSLLSLHPQLEIVKLHRVWQITNEIIPHLSNCCPFIKSLSLCDNSWVNDETLTILSQGFSNLKYVNIQSTNVTNEEIIRLFINSQPHLIGLLLPSHNHQYSKDFLIFYLTQLILPSILHYKNKDIDYDSLIISSLLVCSQNNLLDETIVNPELFSVDILKNLLNITHTKEEHENVIQIYEKISNFDSMMNVILEANIFPYIFNYLCKSSYSKSHKLALNLVARACNFCPELIITYNIFPVLFKVFKSDEHSMINIFWELRNHFSYLTNDDMKRLIKLLFTIPRNQSHSSKQSVNILSHLYHHSAYQHLIDSKNLLDVILKNNSSWSQENTLPQLYKFISINEQNRLMLISENYFPMTMKSDDFSYVKINIQFFRHCLVNHYEDLVEHLLKSTLLSWLLDASLTCHQDYRRLVFKFFEYLLKSDSKYAAILTTLNLPKKMREKLFGIDENVQKQKKKNNNKNKNKKKVNVPVNETKIEG